MSDGGKGSAPRPFSIGHDTFAKQFEAIFGKKDDKNSPSAQCSMAQTGSEGDSESTKETNQKTKSKIGD